MAKLDARTEHMGTDETLSTANENQTLCQSLSDSEAQVLLLIAAGKQTGDIAAAVGTDQAAVKEHIKAILRKAMGYRQTGRSKGTDLGLSDFPSGMRSPFIA